MSDDFLSASGGRRLFFLFKIIFWVLIKRFFQFPYKKKLKRKKEIYQNLCNKNNNNNEIGLKVYSFCINCWFSTWWLISFLSIHKYIYLMFLFSHYFIYLFTDKNKNNQSFSYLLGIIQYSCYILLSAPVDIQIDKWAWRAERDEMIV
jgi:hypothetical protein